MEKMEELQGNSRMILTERWHMWTLHKMLKHCGNSIVNTNSGSSLKAFTATTNFQVNQIANTVATLTT